MIVYHNGDIFNSNKNVILSHQVNCMGIMGSGIALQVKIRYPKVYYEYSSFCYINHYSKSLLGGIQVVEENGRTIANLFAQHSYGGSCVNTDYDSLKECFYKLLSYSNESSKSIAIPYGIGCGLGGGEWEIVQDIIFEIFSTKENVVEIWKY